MPRVPFIDLFSKGRHGRQGAIAIEFALILPVFLYLLVGILEVSVLFFTTTVVDGEIEDAARKIRTGEAQLSGDTLSTFQTELCSSLLGVYDCSNMSYDVQTFSSFSTVSVPDLRVNGNGDTVYDDYDDPVNDDNDVLYVTEFTPGGSGEITVIRVTYSYGFITPLIGGLLGDSGNSKLLSSTAVFRNEPYE